MEVPQWVNFLILFVMSTLSLNPYSNGSTTMGDDGFSWDEVMSDVS